MKRMSEVFELPINGARLERKIFEAHFCTEEDHAAHAINHVDALADALEDLITCCRENRLNILGVTYAEEALAAYRGGK